jgi:GT2 family glycosyltransferase
MKYESFSHIVGNSVIDIVKQITTHSQMYHKTLIDKVIKSNETSGIFFASRKNISPVYYCMVNSNNTEQYTDLAIDTFFKNTHFKNQDKFFLIDNDSKYQLKKNSDKITVISNNSPKTFAENMNLVMKLAFLDKADFIGLNNDLVFTENWNQNFGKSKSISVPLCNQKLTGEYGSLKIKSAMNLEDFDGKENELNEFVKGIDSQKLNIDSNIIGFHCFHIPHEIISKVGFLDENFENGGEDIDYRIRVSQLGYDIQIDTSSYLLHFYGKSIWRSGESKKETKRRYEKYKTYFEKKWGKQLSQQLLVKYDG